jgi:hypothetical protein
MPKYTFDKKRILESRVFYPYLFEFAKILGKIDWTEYMYEGDVYLACESRDKNIKYENEYIVPSVKSLPKKLFYYVFGGSVYELLNNNYKKVVNLHKFTDKTGDLDIILEFPFFDHSLIKEKLETLNPNILDDFKKMERDGVYFYLPLFIKDGTINPCFFHCAKWVLDQMAHVIREDNIYVKEAVDFDIANYITHSQELHYSEIINKMHLIIVSETTMLKIQIVVKISMDGVESIDHVLEFVMSFSSDVSGDKSNHAGILSTSGNFSVDDIMENNPQYIDIPFNGSTIHIQSARDLFLQNEKAYVDRAVFIRNVQRHKIDANGYGSLHKAFNHVGRFLYLITLFKEASYSALNDDFLKKGKTEFQYMCSAFWLSLINFMNYPDYNAGANFLDKWSDLTYYKIENRKFEFVPLSYLFIFIAYLDINSQADINRVFSVVYPGLANNKKLISVGIDTKGFAEVLKKGSKQKKINKNNVFYAELMKLVRSNYNESQNPVLFKKGSVPAADAEVHVHYRSPTPAALRSISEPRSPTQKTPNLAKYSPSKRKTIKSAPHENKRRLSRRSTTRAQSV